MSLLDAYLGKIREYVDDMRQGQRQVRLFRCHTSLNGIQEHLPVRVGPGASRDIIMRSDTFVELGNPEAGSCSFVVWTDKTSMVDDGNMTLVGSDIPESRGASLPFGQVLLIAGEALTDADKTRLEQQQFIADQIEGYMLRSKPQSMWARVSNAAAKQGFDFKSLGQAFALIYKSQVPGIQAFEAVFVTSSKKDVERLAPIAEQVQKISKDILRQVWLAKGYDILECTTGWDCSSCTDKSVCDEIKEVITVRKRVNRPRGEQ
ncbi:MAG: hypothetical protein IBX68_08130 [Dehalococcoidia bacterium]|nr:hypothetical protein [Dehalococcoidia bacterium]